MEDPRITHIRRGIEDEPMVQNALSGHLYNELLWLLTSYSEMREALTQIAGVKPTPGIHERRQFESEAMTFQAIQRMALKTLYQIDTNKGGT